MNINQLFIKQAELDKYIYNNKGVTAEEIFEKKIVAFLDELYELANELEFFKYWKKEIVIDRERVIEEYIDVIHFAVGLATDLGVKEYKYIKTQPQDLNKLFIGITNLATILAISKSKEHVTSLINNVISLGYQLGLNEEIVLDAYDKKNAENYNRQKVGY